MVDPAGGGPVEPTQHQVTGVSGREERTVEGESKEVPGKDFKIKEGPEQTQQIEGTSPLELAKSSAQRGEVTTAALDEQLDRLGQKSKVLQNQLTEERFNQLTPGQKSLLSTKLNQFNKNIETLSPEYKAKEKGTNALKTYVGWLTEGQAQMQSIAKSLASPEAKEISTSAMLRAQAKLQAAERAINFATAVAAKGADFIKTMMQSQI